MVSGPPASDDSFSNSVKRCSEAGLVHALMRERKSSRPQIASILTNVSEWVATEIFQFRAVGS
jgi:hypothetical protein